MFTSSLAVAQSRWPILFYFMQCLTFMESAQYAASSAHAPHHTLAPVGLDSTLTESQGLCLYYQTPNFTVSGAIC